MEKIMEIPNFAVFILTHGRADKVVTYKALRKQKYTGKIYIVIDNEDDQEEEYRKVYGDEVIVFDKLAISKKFDTGDNFSDRRTIVYARNACFEIAQDLGVKYFLELDDDYLDFVYKFNSKLEYSDRAILNLDRVFDMMIKYYKSTNALSIAMAQGGDFIGGKKGGYAVELRPRRKAMNTFFCDVDRPFYFTGRINEDVNTYTNLGSRGFLFLTIPNIAINQKTTQSNKGGMTDVYLASGTYLKSFYSVMYSPSSVKISTMGDKHKRIHHKVSWNNAVPVILREEWKKKIYNKVNSSSEN